MPKLKNRKAAAKRIRLSGAGKFIRRQAGTRHLLEHKRRKTKRSKHRDKVISRSDENRARRMLPLIG